MGEILADNLQGGLAAIALTGHCALTTAYSNDVNGDLIFAQQLYGYAKRAMYFWGSLHPEILKMYFMQQLRPKH